MKLDDIVGQIIHRNYTVQVINITLILVKEFDLFDSGRSLPDFFLYYCFVFVFIVLCYSFLTLCNRFPGKEVTFLMLIFYKKIILNVKV